MRVRRFLWSTVLPGICGALLTVSLTAAQQKPDFTPPGESAQGATKQDQVSSETGGKPHASIEAVVVNPFRSANVGAQVGGVIDRFHFDEGDLVQEGRVVAEIAPKRYEIVVYRAQDKLKAMEVALKQAEEVAQIKGEVFDLDATTRQELTKAKAEAEIARARVGEAKRELELAMFDLECCKIKAPYTGYLAVRYKQPEETVDRLEKVFSLVDSSKVHAVANVPEMMISEFKKGAEARFVYSPTKTFRGVVDKVGILIDPKSKTKRVYMLIDNSGGELEIGMTGTLR
jgi:membrane fusion protein, multidrug efflux system